MSYGQVNADVIGTSVAGSNIGAGNASIMKNRIINGSMTVDQRNAGASIAYANNTFAVDRFVSIKSSSAVGTSQQLTSAPAGFVNSLGFTCTTGASPAAADYNLVWHSIEGFNVADLNWGTANAKTITLSAWVYSSKTGTFAGSIINSGYSRCYVFNYTIPVANTWTQISVTIAGDTTGTWLTTNGIGIKVSFDLGSGSSNAGTAGSWGGTVYYTTSGAQQVMATTGATFYITGVQLEVGSSATGYEYRLYNQELSACQRYYQLTNNFSGSGASTTAAAGLCFWSQMRASPTLGLQGAYSLTDGYALDYTQSSASIAINAAGAINNVGAYTLLANLSGVTSGRPMYSRFVNTNQITLSAEL
jgi:hypothetical protein